MPPQQQNPYDFILNDPQKPARGPLLGKGLGARVVVVAILLVLVIIIGVVVSSFLGKDSKAQTQRLIEITQVQTEIIRVSALAQNKAKDGTTRNLALNTRLSIESSQQQVKKSLAARGVNEKSLNKQIAANKNPKTDAALDEATKNSRFDETFTTIIDKQLTDYQKLLQSAYAGSSISERSTLTAAFENAGSLVQKPGAGANL